MAGGRGWPARPDRDWGLVYGTLLSERGVWIPACAGMTGLGAWVSVEPWIPASAGMTGEADCRGVGGYSHSNDGWGVGLG